MRASAAEETALNNMTPKDLERAVISGNISKHSLRHAKTMINGLRERRDPRDPVKCLDWITRIGYVGTVLGHRGEFETATEFWRSIPVQEWIKDIELAKKIVDGPSFQLARAKIWTTLAWIQHVRRQHSQQDDRKKLIRYVENCVEYVEKELQQPAFKGRHCFATLGSCFALRGFLECDLDHAVEADEWFGKAAEKYLQRLELMADQDEERQDQERRVAFHRVASAQILGSAWVKLRRGALNEAYFVLSSSVFYLSDSHDDILKAFARLSKGCILRAQAGSKKDLLVPAIKELRDSQATFEIEEHWIYYARASFELSMAYCHLGDYESAKGQLDVASYPGAGKSWQSNLLMIRSRISRLRNPRGSGEAIGFAEEALRLAVDDQSQNVGEARVELGQALMAAGRAESAIDPLERALKEAEQNSKLKAVCCVHLALAYFHVQRVKDAHHWLAQYRHLDTNVQNGWVQQYYLTVAERLQSGNSLVIDSEGDLSWHTRERELRKFLLLAADRKFDGNPPEIIGALAISKQTYYNWLKELGLLRVSNPRSGRSKTRGGDAKRKST